MYEDYTDRELNAELDPDLDPRALPDGAEPDENARGAIDERHAAYHGELPVEPYECPVDDIPERYATAAAHPLNEPTELPDELPDGAEPDDDIDEMAEELAALTAAAIDRKDARDMAASRYLRIRAYANAHRSILYVRRQLNGTLPPAYAFEPERAYNRELVQVWSDWLNMARSDGALDARDHHDLIARHDAFEERERARAGTLGPIYREGAVADIIREAQR